MRDQGMPERLARWLVGGRDAEAIAGDLRESGGSRWWYWRQVLSLLLVRISPHRRMIPDLRMDLRLAFRNIRRNPGYGLTAMICLGLAMGVNTTLFSVLDSLYFRKLPVPDAGRVVQIHRERSVACTWAEYLDFRDRLTSLTVAAALPFGAYADAGEMNLMLPMEMVSANYGSLLRLQTSQGRWFTPEEDSPSSPPAMVISDRLWRERFHQDPSVLGKELVVEEIPFRVVGVAARNFRGETPPVFTDAWVPVASLRADSSRLRVNLIGRLVRGATPAVAAAEMHVVDTRLLAGDPRSPRRADPLQVDVASGFAWRNGKRAMQPVVAILSTVCGMVLLIACVNVANLLLSRAAVRRRETAMRLALGAGRGRLFREALTEGAVLAAGGVALGAVFGYWTGYALEFALPSVPASVYQGLQFGIDWRVGLLLAAVGCLSAILFSLPAAFENGRSGVNGTLKGVSGGSRSRQREVYSLAQVALSMALLIGTGLSLRALQHVQGVDPGFARDHRLFVNISMSPKAYRAGSASLLFTNLLQQARRIPGIVDATLALGPTGPAPGTCSSTSASGPSRKVGHNIVEPNYFRMMGVPIVRGRGLDSGPGGPPELVVSETMGRTEWPGEEALGKTLWIGCEQAKRVPWMVVGVARDTRFALAEAPDAAYYVSRRQDPGTGSFALIIRTAGNPYGWSEPLMQAVRSAGPSLRVYEMQSIDDATAVSLWAVKWQAALVTGLGMLAIALAAIGLYGVMAYTVAQRTREIGIRMALGAATADVQWMVLGRGLRLTAIGVAIGLALSVGTVRLLRGYLYGLSPFDPMAFGGAALTWIAIAMLASWFPARRATRVDPLTALKWE